ncbi:hypothetical protein LR48_Vigan03g122900 [Vigna angularis]|uniref:Uncharacterized protein n=1 Tax=Phaseolus angularis TaxID=3914 RepID=A0A0L9U586_PHAAN|nr:hypothetical protein LR48_Vigan03g122900 [Vigna angularis]
MTGQGSERPDKGKGVARPKKRQRQAPKYVLRVPATLPTTTAPSPSSVGPPPTPALHPPLTPAVDPTPTPTIHPFPTLAVHPSPTLAVHPSPTPTADPLPPPMIITPTPSPVLITPTPPLTLLLYLPHLVYCLLRLSHHLLIQIQLVMVKVLTRSSMIDHGLSRMAQALGRAVHVDEVFAQTQVQKGTNEFVDERSRKNHISK